MPQKPKSSRSSLLIVLIAATFLGLGARFVYLQVGKGAYYEKKGKSIVSTVMVIPAARGEIWDRNGNPLVINRMGNSILLHSAYFPSDLEEGNRVILSLVHLMKTQKEDWQNTLPLELAGDGTLRFALEKDSLTRLLKSKMELNDYATAENCYDALVKRYELSSYSKEEVLDIASVRFQMVISAFSTATPLTFAQDVAAETTAKIKENSTLYQGALVEVVPYREYVDGALAPHLLGALGPISAEEYKKRKDKGYQIDDEIGKSGIEAAMESELRGTPGQKRVTVSGKTVTEEILKEPEQGNTIVLTIDRDLQKAVEASLNQRVPRIHAKANGAAVVQQVGTGEILAAANYPSYDNSTYYKDYGKLLKAENNPLFNRYANGLYEPGSTFKPAMALASLQEGKITPETKVNCTHLYERDQNFQCLGTHGPVNVVTALQKSCNIFFYECANSLGIDTMDKYLTQFGFGQKTGVEIPESKGLLAGIEERTARGGTWMPGDTWQAGIGQSDNVFTPLQLSSYVSTLASRGKRFESHFVRSVHSYDGAKTVRETQGKLLNTVGVNDVYYDTVLSGMRAAAGQYADIKNLSPAVASKTGTTTLSRGSKSDNSNGFIIAFAPYERPEISIAVAVEHAPFGANTAPIVADIHAYYYHDKTKLEQPQNALELLE